MSFSKSIVLNSLLSMKSGSLQLILPDGNILTNNSTDSSFSARIEIRSEKFFDNCFKFGAVGFAESYIDGEWETENLTDVVAWFIRNSAQSTVLEGSSSRNRFLNMLNFLNTLRHRLRPNSIKNARTNIKDHYDLGNDFFSLFLDSSMAYSSGLFLNGQDSLQSAQEAKFERLCRMLNLKEGDRVLEIGCGWASFAIYAAQKYKVHITGITISKAQFDFAQKKVRELGLEKQIEIRLEDFRNTQGKYDKIVSVEMVEALGDAYVDVFFQKCSQLLSNEGLLAVQLISSADSKYDRIKDSVDFIQKHIFPGSLLLSIERIVRATKNHTNLQLLDLFDFAESYALTLAEWRKNFFEAECEIRKLGFSKEFIRKWNYYFCYCQAAFECREISVLQITLTRPNNMALAQSRAL